MLSHVASEQVFFLEQIVNLAASFKEVKSSLQKKYTLTQSFQLPSKPSVRPSAPEVVDLLLKYSLRRLRGVATKEAAVRTQRRERGCVFCFFKRQHGGMIDFRCKMACEDEWFGENTGFPDERFGLEKVFQVLVPRDWTLNVRLQFPVLSSVTGAK